MAAERAGARAWDETVDLVVEAISLLEQRQRESEARSLRQIEAAEARAARAERRQADLEAAVTALSGQVARLADEVSALRAQIAATPVLAASPALPRSRTVWDRFSGHV